MRETSLSLLERLQRRDGDEAAWQEFIGRYAGLLRIWCTGWGVASADIDDVIQDTLVQVLSSLPGFQRLGRGSFRGWMKTIARRCWLQMIKRFDERKRPAQLTQELAS